MLSRFEVETAFDRFVHGDVGKILYNVALAVGDQDNPMTIDNAEKMILESLAGVTQIIEKGTT